MTTLTIRLPEDTGERLKQLAASRGISVNKLIEELGTAALSIHDTETRFRLLAASADREAALAIVARLDDLDDASGCAPPSSGRTQLNERG
jgi:predicted transcriptional regulator